MRVIRVIMIIRVIRVIRIVRGIQAKQVHPFNSERVFCSIQVENNRG